MGLLPSVVVVHGFLVLADGYIGLRLASPVNPFRQEQMSPCFEDVLLLLSACVVCSYGLFSVSVVIGTKRIRSNGAFETLDSFAMIAFPPQETRMLDCGRLIA